MNNLIRMDMRRMLSGKGFYICLIILTAATIMTYGVMYLMTNQSVMEWLVGRGIMPAEELQAVVEMSKTYSGINLLGMFHSTNIHGGFQAMVTAIMAAIFVCSEYDGGFIKNILSIHENKWRYVLSKILTLSVMNFLYLSITFLVCMALNVLAGGYFAWVSVRDVLFYGFSAWLLLSAFGALSVCVCLITRSKTATITAGFFLGSGVVVVLLQLFLNLFGLGGIMNYTIYSNLSGCPMSYTGAGDLRALAVGCFFLVFYTVAAGIAVRRKDV